MNQYAVSPILPLSTKGSGKSGSKFDTRWQVNVPYDGYYTLKGAADDRASLLIYARFLLQILQT